jgi:chaperonin GroES
MAKKCRFRPLGNRVVIEQSEAIEKTTGGILLPDSAREKPQQGVVLAVGPGKLLDSGNRAPMLVKEGDTVLYAKYAGTEVETDGCKYFVLTENDILAVVE